MDHTRLQRADARVTFPGQEHMNKAGPADETLEEQGS